MSGPMLVDAEDMTPTSLVMVPANLTSRRSDAQGLIRLSGHLLVLAVTGALLVRAWSTPWITLTLLIHGFVLIFLFCPEHECIHRTAFKSRAANDVVAASIGLLLLLPSRWFRLFHAAHHRHTQDPQNDPELDGWKPSARRDILLHSTGALYWKAMAQTLWRLLRGQATDSWLPVGHRRKVIRQARFMAGAYLAVLTLSVLTHSWLAVQVWLVPVLVGQPFLRWYLLAEHTGCPTGQGPVVGTRTTLTNPVMRFFTWNMPFHNEHHTAPNLPFHQLPALYKMRGLQRSNEHAATDWTNGIVDRGYVRTVARIQRARWRSAHR